MVTRGSSSHIWCESCHARRIHATSKFRMCRACSSRHVHALKEERKRIKASRASRRDAVLPPVPEEPRHISVEQAVAETVARTAVGEAVEAFISHPYDLDHAVERMHVALDAARALEETPTVPESKPPAPVPPVVETKARQYPAAIRAAQKLPEDVRLEIGAHYENLAITVDLITSEYKINLATLMEIVRDLGLQRRSERADYHPGKRAGTKPGYFSLVDGKRIWMSGRKPTPSQRAYEKGLRDAAPKVERTMPLEPTVPVHDVGFEDQPLWLVSIEAMVEVHAERIEDAITQARVKYPHARIRGVNIG